MSLSSQEQKSTSDRETEPQILCRPPYVANALLLDTARKEDLCVNKTLLKQSCIEMPQIRAHCLRSCNMIDCNNSVMY